MPSRRTHTNSHHGCVQCKAGRVKCDEEQPVCRRCQKRHRECTYRHLLAPYDAFQQYRAGERQRGGRHPGWRRAGREQGWSSEAEVIEVHRPPPRIAAVGLPDPEPAAQFLLHHYFQYLATFQATAANEWDILPVFHQAAVRHVTEACVYQAVLAFSAMHLSSMRSSSVSEFGGASSRHLVAALSHKVSTLELLRPMLASNLTHSTCESALTAAGLLVACEFALPLTDPTASFERRRIELLTQVAGLFRGAVSLFRIGRRGFNNEQAGMVPQIRRSVVMALVSELPWREAEDSVDDVLREARGLGENQRPRREALVDAGVKLQRVLRRVAAARDAYHVACMWLGFVSPSYVDLVAAQDPLALVLLAHWAVCLKDVDSEHVWWIRGWRETTIKAVASSVGESYSGLMKWPVQEMGL